MMPKCRELVPESEEFACVACPLMKKEKYFCKSHAEHFGKQGHMHAFLCVVRNCTNPIEGICSACPSVHGEMPLGFCEEHLLHKNHALEINEVFKSCMPAKSPDETIRAAQNQSISSVTFFASDFLKGVEYVRFEVNMHTRHYVHIPKDGLYCDKKNIFRYVALPETKVQDTAALIAHKPNILDFYWYYRWDVIYNANRCGFGKWISRSVYSTERDRNLVSLFPDRAAQDTLFLWEILETRCSSPEYSWLVVRMGLGEKRWKITFHDNILRTGAFGHNNYHRQSDIAFPDEFDVSFKQRF